MTVINSKTSLVNDLYKNSFTVLPAQQTAQEKIASKPIVNIQYINSDGLEGTYVNKPKKPLQTDTETKKNKPPLVNSRKKTTHSVFSLSNIGLGLIVLGALDFTVKEYLSGSLLVGMGLLGYGIGYNTENIK